MAQAKAKVALKKDTAFDAATSLTLDQPTTGVLSDFCNDVIEKEITQPFGAHLPATGCSRDTWSSSQGQTSGASCCQGQ
jgi:hypothetical protein